MPRESFQIKPAEVNRLFGHRGLDLCIEIESFCIGNRVRKNGKR